MAARTKKKDNRFNKRNNNFAYASHFFVHFFAVFAWNSTSGVFAYI